jgi:hypothetical protein
VRGDQHEPVAGPHRVERPEDRRVPDRVRHRAGVELGQLGAVHLAAATAVAVAVSSRRGRVGVALRLGALLLEELVHAAQAVGERDAGSLRHERQDEVVLLGQVRLEQHPQGGADAGRPHRGVGAAQLLDEPGDDLVLAQHRLDQQAARRQVRGERVERLLLGPGVRQQLGDRPVDEVVTRLGRLLVAVGRHEPLGEAVQRARHDGMVLRDRLRGGGVLFAGGDDDGVHG